MHKYSRLSKFLSRLKLAILYRLICWLRCNSKDRVKVNGEFLSYEDWKGFENGCVWQAFLWDIDDRRRYLTELLVQGGDKDWNDSHLRGQLFELTFFENLPEMIKASIMLESKTKTTEQEE